MSRPRVRSIALLTLALAVGASVPGMSGAASPAGSKANPVKAKAASTGGYLPARVVVNPRQKVWFVSVDKLVHTATANKRVNGKPIFDSLPSAGTFTIRAPKAPGTYKYFCLVHPYQKGVLVVRAPK